MSMKPTTAVFAVLLASAVMVPAAAYAQDDAALLRQGMFVRNHNVSVAQRPKPEYDTAPIRAGAFVIAPTITASVESNDNIYAAETGEQSDTIFRIAPGVAIASDWSRNRIAGFARVNTDGYASHNSEQTTDYAVGLEGRLDADSRLGFAAGGSYERDTEPRGSSASPTGALHPIRYNRGAAYLEATKEFNRLRLTGKLDFADWDYDNGNCTVSVFCPSGVVVQTDRSHNFISGAARGEYAVSPDTSLVGNISVGKSNYRNQQVGEIARDATVVDATVGANFDINHLIRGEVRVGYITQSFDAASLKDISGLSVNGKVEYFVTQLTTVTFTGFRGVNDAGLFNVGGYTTTSVGAQIDHELMRSVVLSAAANYGKDEYEGYDRNDDHTSFQAGLSYFVNRNIRLNVSYNFTKQDSSGVFKAQSYEINRFIASVGYRF